jgi:hypothetical protein
LSSNAINRTVRKYSKVLTPGENTRRIIFAVLGLTATKREKLMAFVAIIISINIAKKY